MPCTLGTVQAYPARTGKQLTLRPSSSSLVTMWTANRCPVRVSTSKHLLSGSIGSAHPCSTTLRAASPSAAAMPDTRRVHIQGQGHSVLGAKLRIRLCVFSLSLSLSVSCSLSLSPSLSFALSLSLLLLSPSVFSLFLFLFRLSVFLSLSFPAAFRSAPHCRQLVLLDPLLGDHFWAPLPPVTYLDSSTPGFLFHRWGVLPGVSSRYAGLLGLPFPYTIHRDPKP